MLKPSLRLFILPLGAVTAIATMASQPNSNADICIVSETTK